MTLHAAGVRPTASGLQPPEVPIEPTLRVTVNGEERTLAAGCSMRGLLEQLCVAPRFIAVEINGALVDPAGDVPLAGGDRVEIVRFVGGG